MLPWQMESVQDGSKTLLLKFGHNRASNSWDIADIEFVWWLVVVGGVQSPFRVKLEPTLGSVELRLGWGFDN